MLVLNSTSLTEVLLDWPRAWGIAMVVAFPVSLLVVPLTQRLVARIIANE
ncbi:DUF2798 domain-containing protein [Thalassotalea euphylliae]